MCFVWIRSISDDRNKWIPKKWNDWIFSLAFRYKAQSRPHGACFFSVLQIDKNHGRNTKCFKKTGLLHKDRMKWRTIEKSESCKIYKIKYNFKCNKRQNA